MKYELEKMTDFSLIGFEKRVPMQRAYEECPRLWDEFWARYMTPIQEHGMPITFVEQAVCDNRVGEFGASLPECDETGFPYMIAGRYRGGEVPDGMRLYVFPDMEWAKFKTRGALPESIQRLNGALMADWDKNYPELEIAMYCNVEWYSEGDPAAADYECGIWIPVRRR